MLQLFISSSSSLLLIRMKRKQRQRSTRSMLCRRRRRLDHCPPSCPQSKCYMQPLLPDLLSSLSLSRPPSCSLLQPRSVSSLPCGAIDFGLLVKLQNVEQSDVPSVQTMTKSSVSQCWLVNVKHHLEVVEWIGSRCCPTPDLLVRVHWKVCYLSSAWPLLCNLLLIEVYVSMVTGSTLGWEVLT